MRKIWAVAANRVHIRKSKFFRRLTMKRICILLVMTGLAALGANAQTVTGSGTTNTIPKFTGSSTIGDSQIRQIDDNIAIKTHHIAGRLRAFESREAGLKFSQP